MADKILMNKNTLTTLKNELKGYHTALPVFEMKEQQLKEVIQVIETAVDRLEGAIAKTNKDTKTWAAVMAEDTINLSHFVLVNELKTKTKEIAGVIIEQFVDLSFEEQDIDYLTTPLWVDAAIEAIKDQKTNQLMLQLELKNLESVKEELAEARRMKNALKEVFIPETKNNIRKIEIYLGDVERLAIGCAKLVKKKKQVKSEVV
ncbi:V-type ATP synthase subunit D [Flavivirga rizhaonensis]|uniref:V-type ATP synthase subunit D n=1 Tax=Flavivirga rizhaonensis TaxID=2559571 RepID=A0A4V3P5C5_9FLAO|nr:V-type ATP synthase subunit D [Flavivirga rizhaonensis]TGV04854.1 V-type ATP synthase subunit D [Flavivirga rizhaonensis]